MNYTVAIQPAAGILGLKLVAVAGDLTDANSLLAVDDEFIATCTAGDSVVVFKAGAVVLGETTPATGIPTGNYALYYTLSVTTPAWVEFEELGTCSVINSDIGLILDGKVLQTAYDSKIGTIEGDITDLETDVGTLQTQMTAEQGKVSTLQGKVSTLEETVDGLTIVTTALTLEVRTFRDMTESAVLDLLAKVSGTETERVIGNYVLAYYFAAAETPNWDNATNKVISSSNTLIIAKPKEGDAVYVVGETYFHYQAKYVGIDGSETDYQIKASVKVSEPPAKGA